MWKVYLFLSAIADGAYKADDILVEYCERGCISSSIPEDCVYDEYEQGECSAACGAGHSLLLRKVKNVAAHSGRQCPSPAASIIPCNVDCQLCEWSPWNYSPCPACGPGTVTRTRRNQAQAGNTNYGACSGQETEELPCFIRPCSIPCTKDESFGPLSGTCGEVSYTRKVKVITSDGSEQCVDSLETLTKSLEPCPVLPSAPLPVDCQYEDTVSSCSVTCGRGHKQISRRITVQAYNGGAECPNGPTTEPCAEYDCPCACGTEIDVAGYVQYCDGQGNVVQKTPACNDPRPVDCEFSEWRAGPSNVYCGLGTQVWARGVERSAKLGGASCNGPFIEYRPFDGSECPTLPPRESQCAYTAYEYTDCVSCGAGTLRKWAHKVGDGYCQPENDEQELECNLGPCPQQCLVAEREYTSSCKSTGSYGTNCGPGVRSTIRRVLRRSWPLEDAYGATNCQDEIGEEPCDLGPCSEDCECTNWYEGPLSSTCGRASFLKICTNVHSARNGGKQCNPATFYIQKQVNLDPCPIDCLWGNWEKSCCSVTCGQGVITHRRSKTREETYGGLCCGDTLKEEACDAGCCPEDGVLGEFREGPCSNTCGGTLLRERPVVKHASCGGQEVHPEFEVAQCGDRNGAGCNPPCAYDGWQYTSECNAKCGEPGVKTLTRTASRYSGNPSLCPTERKEEPCYGEPCPVDCECLEFVTVEPSNTCGAGESYTYCNKTKPAQFGGRQCNLRVTTTPVKLEACPVCYPENYKEIAKYTECRGLRGSW